MEIGSEKKLQSAVIRLYKAGLIWETNRVVGVRPRNSRTSHA
jgi:hypothetical protein